MALHRIVIRQAINTPGAVFKWSNVYFADVADVPAAAAFGQDLAQASRQYLDELAFVYEVYASDLLPGTDNFTVQAISGDQLGLFVQGTTDFMPPFVCVRVDIGTALGRPSRKFVRAPWREASIMNGTGVTGSVTAALDDFWSLAFTTGSPLRDVDGEQFVSFAIRSVTSRRLGREASVNVPPTPAS